MPRLLIATNNIGKLKEIRSLLSDLDLQLVSPMDLQLNLDIKEDGSTYKENAAKKAISFSRSSGLVSLADDTGLEVEALDGAPGLYSARYAPQPNATDENRRAYLINQLKIHPHPWRARFRCVVAIATPKGDLFFSEGICPGEIISEGRGLHGFGYDPIFFIPSIGSTMAELSMLEKNRISHRALAVLSIRDNLINIFQRY